MTATGATPRRPPRTPRRRPPATATTAGDGGGRRRAGADRAGGQRRGRGGARRSETPAEVCSELVTSDYVKRPMASERAAGPPQQAGHRRVDRLTGEGQTGQKATAKVVSPPAGPYDGARRSTVRPRRRRAALGRSTRASPTSPPAHELACARHLLDRRPRRRDRRARRRGAVALVLGRLDRHLGAGRGRRRGHAVDRRARLRPAAARPARGRRGARARRSRRAARRRRAGRAFARSPSSTPRAGSPSTPATAASRTPATCAGDGFSAQANMMASAEVWPAMARGVRGGRRAAGAAAARGARRRGGGRRRRARAPVGGPARRRRRGRGVGARVELRVEDHADPLAELAPPARPSRRLRARRPRRRARRRGSTTRGRRSCYVRGRGGRARQRSSCASGPASGIAAAGELEAGARAGPPCDRAADPAGAELLAAPRAPRSRPAAPAVREALGLSPEP